MIYIIKGTLVIGFIIFMLFTIGSIDNDKIFFNSMIGLISCIMLFAVL